MDATGKVGGILDIAKCIYDAVNRLEKASKTDAEEAGGEEAASSSTVMMGAVMQAAKAMKGKASAKNQKALQVKNTANCGKQIVIMLAVFVRPMTSLACLYRASRDGARRIYTGPGFHVPL